MWGRGALVVCCLDIGVDMGKEGGVKDEKRRQQHFVYNNLVLYPCG